jgi:hypothetical protein
VPEIADRAFDISGLVPSRRIWPDVFAVRIWNSRFRHADGFPTLADPAPVDPTVAVGFSKRAQVDVESVDVYHRAAPCNYRKQINLGRVHEPIHVLRPTVIIEAHGHAKVVVLWLVPKSVIL